MSREFNGTMLLPPPPKRRPLEMGGRKPPNCPCGTSIVPLEVYKRRGWKTGARIGKLSSVQSLFFAAEASCAVYGLCTTFYTASAE